MLYNVAPPIIVVSATWDLYSCNVWYVLPPLRTNASEPLLTAATSCQRQWPLPRSASTVVLLGTVSSVPSQTNAFFDGHFPFLRSQRTHLLLAQYQPKEAGERNACLLD